MRIMRNVFNYSLAIFIGLCSTFYVPGMTFDAAQGNLFKIGILLLLIMSWYIKPRRICINPWVNLFPVLGLIVIGFGDHTRMAAMMEPYVTMLLGVTLIYLIANYVEDEKLIINAFCAVIGINAVMVLLQILGVDPLALNDVGKQNTHIVGFFGRKYQLGSYMAGVIPLLLLYKRRTFAGLALALTFFSESWSGLGIAVIAILACGYVYLQRRFFYMFLGGMLLASILLYTLVLHQPDENYTLKYKLGIRWKYETELLKAPVRKPFVGQGMGVFQYIGPQIISAEFQDHYGRAEDATNDYLEKSIEMGLGVIIIWLGLCWFMIMKVKRYSLVEEEIYALFICLCTLPIGMMFHSYFNHINVIILYIVALGLFMFKDNELTEGGCCVC